MKKQCATITCKDGTTLSVQASSFHYCSPKNDEGPYTCVEVGFPSSAPSGKLKEYGDGSGLGQESEVYGYVPWDAVYEFIFEEHGGIVDGELPPIKESLLVKIVSAFG